MRAKVIVFASGFIFLLGVLMMVISAAGWVNATWQPVVRSLGSYLTVTILLGFLYRVTVRDHDDAKFEAKLLSVLDRKIDDTISKSVYYGFTGFVEPMNFESLFESLQLEDTLWWLDTYDPRHQTWLESLEEAIKRGATVNFLVLNAHSPLAAMRATELGPQFTTKRFRADLASFNESLNICLANTETELGQINIMQYNDLPCAPIYVVERAAAPVEAFTGMFLGNPTGLRFPHSHWQAAPGDYIGHLYQYVTQKWNANAARQQQD